MYVGNIVVEAGSDWGYSWPLLAEDGESALDPTSWIATAVVVPDDRSKPVLHWSSEPTLGQGQLLLATGSVTLLIPPEMSVLWRWYSGQYEVRLVDSSGRIDRTLAGRIIIDPAPEVLAALDAVVGT